MIDSTTIQKRIEQLQQERQQVAAQLQTLLTQAEQARHMMSAYDGAIGELARLLEEAAANGLHMAQADTPVMEGSAAEK